MQQADKAKSSGVALVTGAAQRIGHVIACDLASAGWSIALHYHRSEKAARETCAKIRSDGGTAEMFQADLADCSGLSGLIGDAAAKLGPVTCLINNASLFEFDDIASMTPNLWQAHMAVNLQAPVFLAQAMAAALPAGHNGNIINIIDQRVWKLNPCFFSYTISKSALWTATRTLAQALAPRIRVNAIGPGPTLANTRQTAESFARQQQATPLGRGATPGEIAAGVRFILDAPALTGQMIALDGGQHLAWQTPDITQAQE